MPWEAGSVKKITAGTFSSPTTVLVVAFSSSVTNNFQNEPGFHAWASKLGIFVLVKPPNVFRKQEGFVAGPRGQRGQYMVWLFCNCRIAKKEIRCEVMQAV